MCFWRLVHIAQMTVSIVPKTSFNSDRNGFDPDAKAALAAVDPQFLGHVVDRLRSAGNAAFKNRAYGGQSSPDVLNILVFTLLILMCSPRVTLAQKPSDYTQRPSLARPKMQKF